MIILCASWIYFNVLTFFFNWTFTKQERRIVQFVILAMVFFAVPVSKLDMVKVSFKYTHDQHLLVSMNMFWGEKMCHFFFQKNHFHLQNNKDGAILKLFNMIPL